MIASLEFATALVLICMVVVLAFVAWKVVVGLHQLSNAEIAPQPPARLAELRMSGSSNLSAAAFGFAALTIAGALYLYGPALLDWFAV